MDPVARLVARAEIGDVLGRYCAALDAPDYEALGRCYFPDAIHERGEFRGSGEEIVAWIRGIRETLIHCWHLLGEPLFLDLAEDRAEVDTACLANQRLPASAERPEVDRITPCRYRDTFERRDGEWRIAHRRAIYLPAQELPVSASVTSPDHFRGA
jgi:ketosteroid isomerase-like protein